MIVHTATKPAAAPLSQVARFVVADIKGGEQAHDFRMSVISTAILEGYKGNFRNMQEAATFATGKAKKARAYAAGFVAVGTISKLDYSGKWEAAANAPVREQAALLSQAAEFAFEAAFLTVMAEQAAPKAKADKPAAAAAVAAAKEAALAPATPASVELGVTELVDTIVTAIQQGMLSAEELVLIRAALAATDTDMAPDAVLAALLSAEPTLLQAQAH